MTTYKDQAIAIQILNAIFLGASDDARIPQIAQASKDAEVTLNAIALVGEKRIIENERLRQIVEDFCKASPDMHLGEVQAYQDDMKKILNQK